MEGWIKISRKLSEHWIWSDERKLKWWLDLLIRAAWCDTTEEIGKQIVPCRRGEIITTTSALAERWHTDKHSVCRFLDKLETFGMIERTRKGATISATIGATISATKFIRITICKYDEYQSLDDECATISATIGATISAPMDRKRESNKESSKEISKEKKEIYKERKNKEDISYVTSSVTNANINARRDKFFNSLIPYVEKYGKQTVRSFFDYWSELNKSKTKMRWELQATWETSRRLAYWASKDNKFSSNETNSRGYKTAEQRAGDVADIMARLAATNSTEE